MALLLVLALLGLSIFGAGGQEERVAGLLRRQAESKDGVVSLDDAAVRHLAESSNRPYSLLIFFDAVHLKERSDLKLGELRSEFVLLAKSYIKNNVATDGESQIFFCSLEFQHTQSSFAAFGVNSLPHIRFVAAGSAKPSESEVMELSDLTRSAEGMASFVESRIKRKVGAIDRPPLLSRNQLILVGLLVVASAPFLVKKLLLAQDSLIHSSKIWCLGALFVYFFSVSGGMHNIIRKMPLFMADRKDPSKLVFFYQGSGMQLGAEGFVIGSLYTMLGLIVAFITHLLPKLRSKVIHRLVMLVMLAVCFLAVTKVVSLDHWKTGYEIHAYLPRRWH